MKTIIVMDVPAEYGGALTILNQYYNKALADKKTNWIFITSVPILKNTTNVKNIRFPWIKKSWFHRLYFDKIVAPKLIKKHNADEVLSLQNVIVPRVKIPQTVYVHQPLPFIDRKFTLKENKKFWVYQNIIGRMIFKSIKKSDKVIVQTKWMKDAVIKKTKVEESKVTLEPPVIDFTVGKKFDKKKEHYSTFFYPASGILYKNHTLIIEAVKILKEEGISGFNVTFTLNGNENAYVASLFEDVKVNGLPIEFAGSLTYEDVLNSYSKSVLLFPSYIETFGLPMLEAREHHTPILASNMPFSKEILNGYSDARFFDSKNHVELSELMKSCINHSVL